MNASHGEGRSGRWNEPAAGSVGLRREIEASHRALLAADQAEVNAAMDSVRWERRGLLQRLTRSAR